jgi:hypothetical protein
MRIRGRKSSSPHSSGRPILPGVGFLLIRGERFTIPGGFHIVWKTRAM